MYYKSKLNKKKYFLEKKNKYKPSEKLMEKNKKFRRIHNVTVTLTHSNTFMNLSETAFKYSRMQPKGNFKNIEKGATKTITYLSAGSCGFKGSQKASPMANATIGELAAIKFKKYNYSHLGLRLLGTGKRRKETVINIAKQGLPITYVIQETQRPHNGVRLRKHRRI